MAAPIIPNDPRIALMFDTVRPIITPSTLVQSVYEPIYLPDGEGNIPSAANAEAVALERLGPSPQMVQDPTVVFPTLPVSSPLPLPYGQRLPAPNLPTGPSPVVPSSGQPMVEQLTAPRYISESSVQSSVRPTSYPVVNAPSGVSTVDPGVAPAVKPAIVAAPGIAPMDSPYTPPDFSLRSPVPWYQSIPSAPGAPAVSSWGIGPSALVPGQYAAVRMDNGSIAYVPAPPAGSSVHIEAPSVSDARYTQARASDGTTVYVAKGVPLPPGVVSIPGVTDSSVHMEAPPSSIHMEAPSSGDTRYTTARAADGSLVSVARAFPLPAGVTPIPGVTDMAPPSQVLTWPSAPQTLVGSGLPGWVLPAAGIGLVLFFLLKKSKKEEGK